MAIPAAIMAGGAIIGGVMGSNAAKSAARTQADAANNATNLQQKIYQNNQENLHPYMDYGNQAAQSLSSMLAPGGQFTKNFSGQDYLNNQDPGYQFQLQQGNQALQSSLAAKNGVLSGSAMKDLVSYNQGMASTGYQNAFNRWNTQQGNLFQRLSSMAGLGENAAAGAGNNGVQSGANIANTMTGAGNAQAAGQIGSANAIGGAISNAGSYYSLYNMMKPQSGAAPMADQYGYAGGQDLIAKFAESQ